VIKALSKFISSLGADAPNDQQTSEHDIDLCCFALMVNIAKIDSVFDPDEYKAILNIGQQHFGLTEAEANALLEEAISSSDDAVSLHQYTSIVNENFDEPQKFSLVTKLWQVAYTDGEIDRYEEHIIRRIADLVHLDHMRFIEAKLGAQNTTQ